MFSVLERDSPNAYRASLGDFPGDSILFFNFLFRTEFSLCLSKGNKVFLRKFVLVGATGLPIPHSTTVTPRLNASLKVSSSLKFVLLRATKSHQLKSYLPCPQKSCVLFSSSASFTPVLEGGKARFFLSGNGILRSAKSRQFLVCLELLVHSVFVYPCLCRSRIHSGKIYWKIKVKEKEAEMDLLTSSCELLRLHPSESEKVDGDALLEDSSPKDLNKALIGRLWHPNQIHCKALHKFLVNIWKPKSQFKVYEIGNNRFSFQFTIEADTKFILSNGPWHFQNRLLIVSVVDPSVTIEEHDPSTLKLWASIHNLPISFYNKPSAVSLGNKIGNFFSCSERPNPLASKVLKVCVEVNINDPLCRLIILSSGGKDRVCRVSFDNLPYLCYRCGRLIHVLSECPFKGTEPVKQEKYGPWIRSEFSGSLAFMNDDFLIDQSSGPVRRLGNEILREKNLEEGSGSKHEHQSLAPMQLDKVTVEEKVHGEVSDRGKGNSGGKDQSLEGKISVSGPDNPLGHEKAPADSVIPLKKRTVYQTNEWKEALRNFNEAKSKKVKAVSEEDNDINKSISQIMEEADRLVPPPGFSPKYSKLTEGITQREGKQVFSPGSTSSQKNSHNQKKRRSPKLKFQQSTTFILEKFSSDSLSCKESPPQAALAEKQGSHKK